MGAVVVEGLAGLAVNGCACFWGGDGEAAFAVVADGCSVGFGYFNVVGFHGFVPFGLFCAGIA